MKDFISSVKWFIAAGIGFNIGSWVWNWMLYDKACAAYDFISNKFSKKEDEGA